MLSSHGACRPASRICRRSLEGIGSPSKLGVARLSRMACARDLGVLGIRCVSPTTFQIIAGNTALTITRRQYRAFAGTDVRGVQADATNFHEQLLLWNGCDRLLRCKGVVTRRLCEDPNRIEDGPQLLVRGKE